MSVICVMRGTLVNFRGVSQDTGLAFRSLIADSATVWCMVAPPGCPAFRDRSGSIQSLNVLKVLNKLVLISKYMVHFMVGLPVFISATLLTLYMSATFKSQNLY